MGAPGDDGWTLDLVVRGIETPGLVSVHGAGSTPDTVELDGVICTLPPDSTALPLAISLSDLDPKFSVQEIGDDEWILLADGEETKTAIRSFRSVPALDGRYATYSGVLTSPAGAAEFVAMSDPLPFIVILGGVAVAGCLAYLSGTVVLKHLEARLNGLAEKCRAQGGFPEVKVKSRLHVGLHGFSCNPEAEVVCRDLAGKPISDRIVVDDDQVEPGAPPDVAPA